MLPHNLVNEFEHYLFFIMFDDLKKYIYIPVIFFSVILNFKSLKFL